MQITRDVELKTNGFMISSDRNSIRLGQAKGAREPTKLSDNNAECTTSLKKYKA